MEENKLNYKQLGIEDLEMETAVATLGSPPGGKIKERKGFPR
jgi:hypothetical protein